VAVGNFDLKIPTENIPSVNPLVFSEFLVVFQVNSLLFHCCHAIDTVLCINSQQGSGTGLCTVAVKVTSTQ